MNNNIWDLKQRQKVCAIDIDGVLCEYPNGWLNFIREVSGEVYHDLNHAKGVIPYDVYKRLKKEYRLCGAKEKLARTFFASELTYGLRNLGYTIIIITARPVDDYPCLFSQTINWLKNNNIYYDAIHFEGRNKHTKILSDVPNLKFMIEDNSYIANMVSKWGYKVFLVDNPYNQGLTLEKNVVRVNNLQEVYEHVKKL